MIQCISLLIADIWNDSDIVHTHARTNQQTVANALDLAKTSAKKKCAAVRQSIMKFANLESCYLCLVERFSMHISILNAIVNSHKWHVRDLISLRLSANNLRVTHTHWEIVKIKKVHSFLILELEWFLRCLAVVQLNHNWASQIWRERQVHENLHGN